jgi:hypothetical protein
LSFTARAAIGLALSTTLLFGGCAAQIEADRSHTSSTIASGLPTWAGGEPANVPARPSAELTYPAINAPVTPREAKALTPEEQSKEIAGLQAARKRALASAKTPHTADAFASDEGSALTRGKYAGNSPPSPNSN